MVKNPWPALRCAVHSDSSHTMDRLPQWIKTVNLNISQEFYNPMAFPHCEKMEHYSNENWQDYLLLLLLK